MLKLPFAISTERHLAANNEARVEGHVPFPSRAGRGGHFRLFETAAPEARLRAVFAEGVRSYSPSERKRGALWGSPSPGFTWDLELQSNDTGARQKRRRERGEWVMGNYGTPADFSRQLADGVLDEHHLRAMTLGDESLEREVLQVFARQITLMLKRIARAEPAHAAAAAHTLKGSARGLGAWRVAEAAERVEQAATGLGDLGQAIAELDLAGSEVRGVIEARLQDAASGAFVVYRHVSIYPA
jgi:HPt (histidine-containing phosphotransfer) domain-containing protein